MVSGVPRKMKTKEKRGECVNLINFSAALGHERVDFSVFRTDLSTQFLDLLEYLLQHNHYMDVQLFVRLGF